MAAPAALGMIKEFDPEADRIMPSVERYLEWVEL